jgi:pilus assembly protein CpaE
MHRNLLFLSSDARLIERLEAALANDLAVMAVDPRNLDIGTVAARFSPQAIAIDAGAHTGARTILEQMASVRAAFPGLPLIAIGDEMSAQLILTAFRAGVDDFVDRDASDRDIRQTILHRLHAKQASPATSEEARLVNVLSTAPCDEDGDLALNIASLIAQADGGRRTLLLDLSLPVTPVRAALGLDFDFTLAAALRDMARLDHAFLESAVTRAPDSGLYILPLAANETEGAFPATRDLAALLQVLQSLFDTVVVCWAAFSLQAARTGAIRGTVLVGCSQRFAAIRNAKSFLSAIRADDGEAEPVLAIHLLDPHLTPSPPEIAVATGAPKNLVLRASWSQLAAAHNRGRPLALSGPSAYGDALRSFLLEQGLLPRRDQENTTARLLSWLNRARA